MRTLAAVVWAIAAIAWAHTPTPDDVVAELGSPAVRVAAGVERVEQDVRNPRVLLVRVAPAWFGRSKEARAAAAADWYASWRRAVPQGIVGVVDGRTDRAVVRFGRGGTVVDVRDPPG